MRYWHHTAVLGSRALKKKKKKRVNSKRKVVIAHERAMRHGWSTMSINDEIRFKKSTKFYSSVIDRYVILAELKKLLLLYFFRGHFIK